MKAQNYMRTLLKTTNPTIKVMKCQTCNETSNPESPYNRYTEFMRPHILTCHQKEMKLTDLFTWESL